MAYLRLLWMYYDAESPLPDTPAVLALKVGCDVDSVTLLLGAFFALQDGHWHHGRCDKEIADYHAYIESQRAKGALGGRPRKTHGKPAALPEETHGKPGVNPNQQPLTNNQEDIEPKGSSSAKLPDCPHESVIDLFAKHLPNLPQPRKSLWRKGKNAAALKSRWCWVMTENYEKGERKGTRMAETVEDGLAWFDRYFAYVAESDWLTGRAGDWSADLGWLVNSSNFEKVLQGNYANQKAQA